MSILRFLRVIEEELGASGAERAVRRTRPLALETLEGRAVMTLLSELPLLTPPELSSPTTTSEPSTSGTSETTALEEPAPTEPATTDPVTTDPVTTEEPPAESEPIDGIVPEPIDVGQELTTQPLLEAYADATDGWVVISGQVIDDESVAGLTVFCMTSSGLSFSMTVGADGHYQSDMMFLAPGTMISVWTIDLDGLRSNTVLCYV